MATDNQQEHDELILKEPFIKKLLQPQNLKKIIFGVAALAGLIAIIWLVSTLIFSGRPDDVPYQYTKLPAVSVTSYGKNYGTFYCKIKVDLEYQNSSLEDELDEKSNLVTDIVRQVVSDQNYFMINTLEKQRYNLAAAIKERLNIQFRTPGGVKDVTFPQITLQLNDDSTNQYIGSTYFEIGFFNIPLLDNEYKVEIYVIYDASSTQFNEVLDQKKDYLLEQIGRLINQSKFHELMNPIHDERKAKIKLKELVREEIKKAFFQFEAEIIKTKNPMYEERGEALLKDILFTLFKPLKSTSESKY